MDVVADDVIVLGEQRRLRRMVDNVLDNAVRYSPKGGEITVTVAREGTDVAETSRVGWGYLSFRLCRASTRMAEMAMLRYHLWSAGMTNQGACLRLVAERMSS